MLPFFKRYLFVNLTNLSWEIRPLEIDLLKLYGGGKGIGTYLLHKLNPVGVDSLTKEDLVAMSNRIHTLAKNFNIRENPDSISELDNLPKRLFEEPLEMEKL